MKRKTNPYSFWAITFIAALIISIVIVQLNTYEMEITKDARIEQLKNDRDSWRGRFGALQEEFSEHIQIHTCIKKTK